MIVTNTGATDLGDFGVTRHDAARLTEEGLQVGLMHRLSGEIRREAGKLGCTVGLVTLSAGWNRGHRGRESREILTVMMADGGKKPLVPDPQRSDYGGLRLRWTDVWLMEGNYRSMLPKGVDQERIAHPPAIQRRRVFGAGTGAVLR